MPKHKSGKYSPVVWEKFITKDYSKIIGNVELLKRFESNVRKTETCWVWTGLTINNGQRERYGYLAGIYGAGRYAGKLRAHRLAYLLFKGDLAEELVVDHLCENKLCVNPDHLEAVDTTENLRRYFSRQCCDDCRNQISALRTQCILMHKK
jgi:hypothetical protein